MQALGNGAMLYIPTGCYGVSSTIVLNGSNYVVSGCGQGCMGGMSMIYGTNSFSGPAFNLQNAQNVTLRGLAFELDVEQTSSGGGASSTSYDGLYFFGGDELQLNSLPANSTVDLFFISSGGLDIDNCSQAQILAHFNEVPTTVEGTSAKTGLLGFITFNGVPQSSPMLSLNDNQDLLVDDCYFEQATTAALSLSGNSSDPAGRVTMGFSRADAFVNEMSNPTLVNINDYQGRVSVFRGTWEQENVRAGTGEISQTGTRPLWLALMGAQIRSP